MHPKALLDECSALMEQVFKFDHPADAVVARYFREHKSLGPRERATLSDTVYAALRAKKIRCELDDRNEKIGYKIREAQLEKVPYMVVVGDKDIENNTISIRKRKEGDLGAMTVEQFLEKIVPDRDNKVID